jgi:hypothetical protein
MTEELCFISSLSGLNESPRTARSTHSTVVESVALSHFSTARPKIVLISNPISLERQSCNRGRHTFVLFDGTDPTTPLSCGKSQTYRLWEVQLRLQKLCA